MPDTSRLDLGRNAAAAAYRQRPSVMVLFGTRPEAIKLAPVVHELKKRFFETIVVSSGQHNELLRPFLTMLDLSVDHELKVMTRDQGPNDVCSKVIARIDKLLTGIGPDAIVVQGDTTTALAGSIAGFNRRIAVAHVEAGLRSGDLTSPFPEEMNRRLITQMATLHFAATEENRRNLLKEGIPSDKVHVVGNPVVDSLVAMRKRLTPSQPIAQVLRETEGKKRILLTTHRRESFGPVLEANLNVIREFIERRKDTAVLFPVHPNPNVKRLANEILGSTERVYLLDPLDHSDFLVLMNAAWLVLSDSGGVQEEAPSFGKPLLVLRENTERPEAIHAGVAKLVGADPASLRRLLDENYEVDTWIRSVNEIANPFGDGHSARRIVQILGNSVAVERQSMAAKAGV